MDSHRTPFKWAIGFALFTGILLVSVSSQARVFKWKDDKGKWHFTDDESKIPFKFRNTPKLEKVKRLAPAAPSSENSEVIAEEDPSKISEEDVGDDAAPKEEAGLSDEDKGLITAAIEYFKREINRNKGLVKLLPNELNGKIYVKGIQDFLPEKKALAGKLGASENAVLKNISGFLNHSISQDEKVQVTGPKFKNRVQRLNTRLRGELGAEMHMITNMEKELKASNGEAS